MRNSMRWLSGLLFLLSAVVVAPATAAPRLGGKADGPMIVGQARSYQSILDGFKELFGKFLSPQMRDQMTKEMLANIDPSLLPGFDPKRPFALHGTLDADFAKSSLVILVPISDEATILKSLKDLGATITESNDGIREISDPDFPLPVAVKFDKGYAHVALGGPQALVKLIDAKDLISEKEKSLLAITAKIDRIPKEVKSLALNILKEQSDSLAEGADPEAKEIAEIQLRYVQRLARMLLEQGRDLTLRVDMDAKSGEQFIEIEIEGLGKTTLATEIAARKPTTNAFGSLVNKDTVAQVSLKAPLFSEELRETFGKLLDIGIKKTGALQELKKEEGVALKELFLALQRTVKAGQCDSALVLNGPDKDGFYGFVGAVQLVDAKKVEGPLIDWLKTKDGKVPKDFQFNVHKVAGLDVHVCDFKSDPPPPETQAIFGKEPKFYLAFGKDAVYCAFGANGLKGIENAVNAKPAPAPVFEIAGNGKKIAAMIRKGQPADNPNPMDTWVGLLKKMEQLEKVSFLSLEVLGGETLRIRLNQGSAQWFLIPFFGMAGAAEFQPVPPPQIAKD